MTPDTEVRTKSPIRPHTHSKTDADRAFSFPFFLHSFFAFPFSRFLFLDSVFSIPFSRFRFLDPVFSIPFSRFRFLDPVFSIPFSRSRFLDPVFSIPFSRSRFLVPFFGSAQSVPTEKFTGIHEDPEDLFLGIFFHQLGKLRKFSFRRTA
ncbi:MAG: hypothetical protein E7029_05285 [Planctomycetaceae bacterium]|nr:hypothetical protein [Planctomycetaceae bacterium]